MSLAAEQPDSTRVCVRDTGAFQRRCIYLYDLLNGERALSGDERRHGQHYDRCDAQGYHSQPAASLHLPAWHPAGYPWAKLAAC